MHSDNFDWDAYFSVSCGEYAATKDKQPLLLYCINIKQNKNNNFLQKSACIIILKLL